MYHYIVWVDSRLEGPLLTASPSRPRWTDSAAHTIPIRRHDQGLAHRAIWRRVIKEYAANTVAQTQHGNVAKLIPAAATRTSLSALMGKAGERGFTRNTSQFLPSPGVRECICTTLDEVGISWNALEVARKTYGNFKAGLRRTKKIKR